MHSSVLEETFPVLKKTVATEAVLTASMLFYAATYLLKLFRPRDNIYSLSLFIDLVLVIIYMPLTILAWHHARRDLNYRTKPLAEELIRTRAVIDKKGNDNLKHRRNTHLFLFETNINALQITKMFIQSPGKKIYEITWNVGTQQIARQYDFTKDLIKNIDAELKHKKEYKIIANSYPELFKSELREKIAMFLPHVSHAIDMPTKMRILNCFGMMALFTNSSLESIYGTSSFNMANFTLLYMLYLSVVITESYFMNKLRRDLNLEGFTNLFNSYTSWPPTCVGQQIGEDLAFYPSNKWLDTACDYFFKASLFIHELKSSDLLPEFGPLRDQIGRFNGFIRETDLSKIQLVARKMAEYKESVEADDRLTSLQMV